MKSYPPINTKVQFSLSPNTETFLRTILVALGGDEKYGRPPISALESLLQRFLGGEMDFQETVEAATAVASEAAPSKATPT